MVVQQSIGTGFLLNRNIEKMLFRKIKSFIGELDTDILSDRRKAVLQPLVGYIRQKVDRQETSGLLVPTIPAEAI